MVAGGSPGVSGGFRGELNGGFNEGFTGESGGFNEELPSGADPSITTDRSTPEQQDSNSSALCFDWHPITNNRMPAQYIMSNLFMNAFIKPIAQI